MNFFSSACKELSILTRETVAYLGPQYSLASGTSLGVKARFQGGQWLTGRVLDSRPRGCGLIVLCP